MVNIPQSVSEACPGTIGSLAATELFDELRHLA
jgi:hypothetical protein